jgi:tRNA (uracil-5-)-methyltransferase TRM9
MNPEVVERLLSLNRQFYQTFAAEFAATRQRLQPGVMGLLPRIALASRILDLGCGNGELAHALEQRGWRGTYVGLDFSEAMLVQARQRVRSSPLITFHHADLADPAWDVHLPMASFDLVLAFAVLHHLPASALRRQVLRKVHTLLKPKGIFIHSEWQFLNSPRMRSRIQPWEKVELRPDQVEAGDYLLDWRHGGWGLRYVHHFSEGELERLAKECGFTISETFTSDGEGGNLGLYQIWQRM